MNSYSLTLTIDELPTLQADKHPNFRARNAYRKKWHLRIAEARMIAGPLPPRPLEKAQVVGIRYCAGVQPDRVNVWSSMKAPLDGMIRCGLILDDNPGVLLGEDYYSVRVRTRAEQRLTISVTSCELGLGGEGDL